MAFLEKSNWVVLILSVATLVVYGGAVWAQLLTHEAAEIGWVQPMIISIVAFIGLNIVGTIVAAISNPREADKKDQRDREIDRLGQRVGNSFVVVGTVVALILTMAKLDYFWIGNAIYLGGILAALAASTTKVAAYHGPFQQW
jgi:NADH:ubiquinone oxidoreductase subunit 6 (subunit J)